MELSVAASLLLIFAIGAVAQWLGWRLRVPAILLLLASGFLAGPVAGVLDPVEVFGELLFPMISGAVAIILFEGGLSLRFHELKGASGSVIFRLISLGVLVSWAVISWLAWRLLGFSPLLALLLGALLTVTGPTVIGPMLRTIRPKGKVRSVAKWEGIMIDPIGVLLAVLIYEILIAGSKEEATSVVLYGILETLAVSVGITVVTAGLVLFMVKKRQLPDFLQNTIVLALLLTAFGASNYLREESGLLTATLFGIVLANQSIFEVRNITEFKENLQILLISFLFVVLAARVDPEAFRALGWTSGIFLLGVIVLARPLAVLASTCFSPFKWSERILLMMLAPRGIVAVALTSVFVIKLDKLGVPEAQEFLALTLLVVVGTVLFYGLFAGFVATRLKLSNLDPQGVIMVGAHDWAIRLAKSLKEADVPVLLIDSNRGNIERARRAGLRGESGNIFSEEFLHELDLSDMGHSVALTANDEVNAFARNALGHELERADTYHLVPTKQDNPQGGKSRRMNPLFAEGANYRFFHDAFLAGAKLSLAVASEDYDLDDLRNATQGEVIPMFCIEPEGRVRIFSAKTQIKPVPGATIIYLDIPPEGPQLPTPKVKADESPEAVIA